MVERKDDGLDFARGAMVGLPVAVVLWVVFWLAGMWAMEGVRAWLGAL